MMIIYPQMRYPAVRSADERSAGTGALREHVPPPPLLKQEIMVEDTRTVACGGRENPLRVLVSFLISSRCGDIVPVVPTSLEHVSL